MKQGEYKNQIIEALAVLSAKVGLSNSISLTDLNIHAETFYKDFLNLVLDYSLKNINILEQNTAAIDLGDENKRIAIQVTSTPGLQKTKKTVDIFIKKKLYDKYDRLIVLNIVKKIHHSTPHIGDDKYKFDTQKDIWDNSDLIRIINGKSLEKLKEIAIFLRHQLKICPDGKLPNEVLTIIDLIEFLSNDIHPATGEGNTQDPDPDGKINRRFSDHAKFLKDSYVDLFTIYGKVLDAIKEETDIGSVQISKISQYLRNYSDEILTQYNNNPKDALDTIIHNFKGIMSKNGNAYDEGAIRFYIIDQLIKCNVFPNKEAESA